MNKTFSTREFAEISGIEASKLRYWDKIGVFSPILREEKTNYRRYTYAQLPALNFVTALSALDIPLEKIAELRRERSPDELLELLQDIEHEMDMEMRNLRLRYSMIHARRELITMGMKVDENAVSVVHMDEKNMFVCPRNEYKEGDTFLEPLSALIGSVHDLRIDLNFPVAGLHDDMASFAKAPGRPDNFLSIDPEGTYTRKAGDYLVGYARGYYGDVGDLPERMLAYATANRLILTGPVYTMYLLEEISTGDASQYLACCSVEVR